ncbi:Insecticidal toxin complex protein TcaB (toxin complex protein) [Xenorhabdus bovienii]|uniref:Tc toxin subunit A-related protein n=1 Tax=Xenorhabdus bovienii TaxID=40576 RepID=UPI001EDD60C4|nr:neuraminidase-like domain-containing protein [Xenorhabdus bovienii]MCG3460804.1 Insecticidal toxin complex protein TcaB (toxin complex protein) [Xenorhabdus bovienii]
MSTKLFTQTLKEARRDALVNHYIASHDFGAYAEKINTADDLYEYLLLDTKISDQVKTSHLSEAVGSLQLYIHRAMEGYDGEPIDNDEVKKWFTQDAFLYNWDRYNKRYSTWAGKEKLRFYAGNYIDPTLRINKTELFKDLENHLNQGKLTTESAENALRAYLASFDKYTSIEYLSTGIANTERTRLYFTGRLNDQYYWREVRLDKPLDGASKPVYWGCWQPLPATIKAPIDDKVVMLGCPYGAYCLWRAMETTQDSGSTTQDVEVSYCWVMRRDGKWEQHEPPIQLSLTIAINGWNPVKPEPAEFNNYFYVRYFANYDIYAQGSVKWNDSERELTVNMRDYPYVYNTLGLAVCKLKKDSGGVYTLEEKLLSVGKGETKSIKIPFKDEGLYGLCGWQKNGDIDASKPLLMSRDNASPNAWEFGSFLINNKLYTTLVNGAYHFTVNAPFLPGTLSAWLEDGIETLQNYNNQATVATNAQWFFNNGILGGDAFSGPYGQYLWEIFFHIPFLIATRLQAEQRFEEAERWYKYIFSSAGYRDEDGTVLTGEDGNPRYWNCYPLQQDSAWDALTDMPASTDPDVIAAADPMHYKLAMFLHTLDFLIVKGDAAYRLLERDTMTEAKMYYVQAQKLLGPRPDIPVTNTWPNPNPTLASEAGSIGTPLSNEGPMTFGQWLSDGDYNEMGDGHFLPPYNDVLLAYWDKLELRLYNLRHNLSLDGQPLSLPLFATPVDPKELQRQQSGGDGIQGDTAAGRQGGIGWRYTLLADYARTAVSQLMQFGASLQNALERQDSEKLTLLMQTQQVSVLKQQQSIAQKNLDSLNASLTALHTGRASAELRKAHYTNLINGDLSAAEIAGLTLRSASMVSNGIAAVTVIGAGIASALPNTFGMAIGGGDFGAPIHALFQSAQATAVTLDQSAGISEVTGGYQRRTEEWVLQRDIAEKEVEQMDAQIDSLHQQMTMAQKQIVLNEMEAANAQALYDLQSSRFTGQALYNWMAGRLSALYYQLYDATIPVCLQAKAALEQELGHGRTDGLFQTPVWNDLWQGLLAGEGLNVELQKLGNVWLEHSAKGLEATRTVSLASQRGEVNGNLNNAIDHVLTGKADTPSHGVTLALNGDGMFSAELDLAELGLNASYNMKNKARYIKSVAVTLPTLLEPYQDIEATLQLGNEVATLSHGMNDNGRFVTNFDDSRFLPFEGADPTSGKLTLTIFHVQDKGTQRATVENLSDVVFHLRYILRDKA